MSSVIPCLLPTANKFALLPLLSSNSCLTAVKFKLEQMSAVFTSVSISVPLVVFNAIFSMFDCLICSSNSTGELPRSKSGNFTPLCSPARMYPSFLNPKAFSPLFTGITSFTPFARAVTIVLEALNTSMTTRISPIPVTPLRRILSPPIVIL